MSFNFLRASASRKTLMAMSVLCLAATCQDAIGAITVMGTGLARSCYLVAEFGGDTASGITTCTRALEDENLVARDRASTYVNRGILRARDDPRGALDDYDQGLEIAPDLAEAYVDRGAALLSLKRYQEALSAINHGLQLNVARPQIAYYDRAVAHEGLGDIRAAYEDYKKAVELSPDFALAKEQLSRFKVISGPAR